MNFLSWVLVAFFAQSVSLAQPDTMAPGRVHDLIAEPGDGDGHVRLSFTAPGNDGQSPERTLNGWYQVTCVPHQGEDDHARPIDRRFVAKHVNYGDPNRVVVALLGDTQFGFPDGVADPAVQVVRPTMADLQEFPHDFLAILGDLVQTDRYWPYHHDEIERKAVRPLYLIGGNAEYYYGLDRFVEHTGFSPKGYVVRLRGLRFIFLTVNDVSGETDHICHIGAEQMAWLRRELAADSDSSTAVFFHAPLAHTTTGSLPEREMYIYETDALRRLFREHPCIVLFANGHLHRGYGPVSAPRHNGPYLIEDGVLHVSVGRPPHTCVAEFASDGITIRVRDNRTRTWCPGWGTTHRVPLTLKPKQLDPQRLIVDNLEPGQIYQVTLRTRDDAGHLSATSNSVRIAARKLPLTPPSSPMDMTVVGDTRSPRYAFTARYRDVNSRDRARACEVEVERCRMHVVDTFGDGDASSWVFTNVADVAERDGLLTGCSSTSDPQMLMRLSPPLDGDLFGTILLRLQVPGNAGTVEFFWGHEKRSVCREQSLRVMPDVHDQFSDYELSVGKHAEWLGHRIHTLRLDPTTKKSQCFAVDSIVLRSRPGRGKSVWRSGSRACKALPQETMAFPLTYDGPLLDEGVPHYWRIRFTDHHGMVGAWSEWTLFNLPVEKTRNVESGNRQ